MDADSYKPVNSDDDVNVVKSKPAEDVDDEPMHVNEDDEAKMSLTGNVDQTAAAVPPSNAKVYIHPSIHPSQPQTHDGLVVVRKAFAIFNCFNQPDVVRI